MSESKFIQGIVVKEKTTPYGKLITGSIKVDKLIESLNSLKNEAGYVNFKMPTRKQVGEKGETHYFMLNEQQPKA